MKIKHTLLIFSLTALSLFSTQVMSADNRGTLTLALLGVVDLAKNPDPSVPHSLKGIITGTTRFSKSPVYSNSLGGANTTWGSGFAYIGLSANYGACSSSSDVFSSIPKTNLTGVRLSHSSNDPSLDAFVIPQMLFTIEANGGGLYGTKFSGAFLSSVTDLSRNGVSCYYPSGTVVRNGGTKTINIYNNTTYPVYLSGGVQAGIYTYKGAPLYITTQGNVPDADAYVRVNITTDLKVIRVCQISNVVNKDISVVMNRNNEMFKESSLSFTCTGDNQQVYMSGIATEGYPDATNPAKLMLNNISSSSSSGDVPWVMGKPFMNGISPALSCNEPNSPELIKFNNEEIVLPKIAKLGEMYNLGIKWAICSKDSVSAGKYRGKALVTIYTKV